MIKNYFKTALRHFRKNKVSAAINILGLSIGISAALVICMIVTYDYSFDKWEPDGNRIYRVVTQGDGWHNQGVSVPLATALQRNISGIEATAPIFDYNEWSIKVSVPQGSSKPDQVFKKQEKVVFSDNNYFSLFPHRWLAGSQTLALQQPYGLVLSESRAKRYFPGISAAGVLGRMVIFSDTLKTTVTGVVADIDTKTDFDHQAIISLNTIFNTSLKKAYQTDAWNSVNSANQVMVKLAPNVNPQMVDKQIAAIYKDHQSKEAGSKTTHHLQALSKIHLDPDFGADVNPETLRNLTLLAIFLLALGAINFINLSTAQASERAREIGIRKTLGSRKGQLIAQFLAETFLLTLFTALLSLLLVPLLLKVFGSFIPVGLSAGYLFSTPLLWSILLLLVVVVSLISGVYPAFVLTRFQPVSVLKNTVINGSGTTRNAWLRRTLIVSQFVIAQVFIIGVLVVNKQVHYAIQKDMGFHKDAIINFYVPMDFNNPNNKKFVLKNEITQLAGVQAVSLGNQSPAFSGTMTTGIEHKEKGKDIKLDVSSRSGDTSFLKVYQIPLIAGRNIAASDTANQLLINETLARQLGFQQPADAVGHMLEFGGSSIPVVGVMHDFNQASVRSAVSPLIYFAAPKFGYVMHIALTPDASGWHHTISDIQKAWKNIYPDVDFDYSFFDQQIEKFYKTERQLSMLLGWSAGVAIIISCLGMLGLVIFMTNGRIKEIGVRKVLGASVLQIIKLLSVDFAKLLILAFVIALPIAWWQTHKWLENFAYHTELSWWIFLLSGAFMIGAALLIVSIRTGKAAVANPVKSLRTE